MAYVLSTMTDAIESLLKDSANDYFSTSEIQDAIEWALATYGYRVRRRTIGTIDDVDGQREYSVATLTDLQQVTRVWWPYDSTDPAHPPNWVHWYMLDDTYLYLDVDDDPDGTEVIRVFYTAEHTISGLAGKLVTTPDEMGCELIIVGAAGRVVLSQSREVIDAINVSSEVTGDWEGWGRARLKQFYDGLDTIVSSERMVGDARISWG